MEATTYIIYYLGSRVRRDLVSGVIKVISRVIIWSTRVTS